jgi:hypothetical protein
MLKSEKGLNERKEKTMRDHVAKDPIAAALGDIAASIDGHAKSIDNLTRAVRDLGNGDAATHMGAIEHLATHLGEKINEAGVFIAEALAANERVA